MDTLATSPQTFAQQLLHSRSHSLSLLSSKSSAVVEKRVRHVVPIISKDTFVAGHSKHSATSDKNYKRVRNFILIKNDNFCVKTSAYERNVP